MQMTSRKWKKEIALLTIIDPLDIFYLAPTLVLAVLGQWDQTATPCQEEECGCYQMAHAAALPGVRLRCNLGIEC